jgi:hypothetical protein
MLEGFERYPWFFGHHQMSILPGKRDGVKTRQKLGFILWRSPYLQEFGFGSPKQVHTM